MIGPAAPSRGGVAPPLPFGGGDAVVVAAVSANDDDDDAEGGRGVR